MEPFVWSPIRHAAPDGAWFSGGGLSYKHAAPTELGPTGSPRQLSVRSGIFIVPPGHHQLRSGMFIKTDTQALRFEQEITEITVSWFGQLVRR